jgi:hypothetical protein
MPKCPRCNHDYLDDHRSWLSGKAMFHALFPMCIIYPDELDIEILGPRVALHLAKEFVYKRWPEGELWFRSYSYGRRL